MDLEEGKTGGTWLGMNVTGKVASLLNIIQPLDEITGDQEEKLPRGESAPTYAKIKCHFRRMCSRSLSGIFTAQRCTAKQIKSANDAVIGTQNATVYSSK